MSNKRSLLIVDDEVALRKLLAELVSTIEGVSVITAENGKQAISIMKNHRFDAILSDIKMPEMDGLEFLKTLRENDNMIPFVILSAFAGRENLVLALRMGAMDFIEKPYKQENVLKIVTKALEVGKELNQLLDDQPDSENNNRKMLAKRSLIELKLNNKKAKND